MSAPRWDVEGRDWPNRPASRFVDTARIRWHVQIMGDLPPSLEGGVGGGWVSHREAGPNPAPTPTPPSREGLSLTAPPTLLLIHGTGAATHSWRDLMPLLAEHFTVVAPDLPGHGFTTGRPAGGLTMPAMARALGELVTTLALPPAVIVGHSAGSAIAIRMALDGHAGTCLGPAAIVGLNAALLPFPGLGAMLFPTLARMLFVNPFAPHIFARIARTPGETGRFLARSTGSKIDPAGVSYYERLFATAGQCSGAITMMADWDLAALKRDLPRITPPLLLIHGGRDAAIPPSNAREAAGLVPGAEVTILPDLGHLAHEERPREVADLITAFALDHIGRGG